MIASSGIEIINSNLIGGIGGKTAPSTSTYLIQAKAGDGAYCDSSNALFSNSILEGGEALINLPPYNIPLNTLGGNGITAVNYSNVIVDGGNLIRGSSSEDAMGKLYYSDSTSSINFTNLVVYTSIYNLSCIFKNNSIRLTWDTRVGLNFMQFEVERMSDENDWNTLVIIKDTAQSLSYIDTTFTVPSRNLKYRIKIINLDSTFSFSETKEIDFLPTVVYNLSCIFENNSIRLTWDTRAGLNFMQFEIERMSDENDWNTLVIIKDTAQSLSYIDTTFTIPSRNLKYRIKIINLDSTFSYSETKEIDFLPTFYELYQNYPNPFNAGTTIKYSLPEKSKVSLKVYDLLGREVTTLVNEEKPAGVYKIKFNGSGLTSGIYFYRIETGSFSETKKLILLR